MKKPLTIEGAQQLLRARDFLAKVPGLERVASLDNLDGEAILQPRTSDELTASVASGLSQADLPVPLYAYQIIRSLGKASDNTYAFHTMVLGGEINCGYALTLTQRDSGLVLVEIVIKSLACASPENIVILGPYDLLAGLYKANEVPESAMSKEFVRNLLHV
jgi:hypothetical protein